MGELTNTISHTILEKKERWLERCLEKHFGITTHPQIDLVIKQKISVHEMIEDVGERVSYFQIDGISFEQFSYEIDSDNMRVNFKESC